MLSFVFFYLGKMLSRSRSRSSCRCAKYVQVEAKMFDMLHAFHDRGNVYTFEAPQRVLSLYVCRRYLPPHRLALIRLSEARLQDPPWHRREARG